MQSDEVCVRSPWWNRWPPSVPAASRWCWSCRNGLAHSRWCSGPRWTPRWAVDTDSGLGPPGPAGGPLWWCGPDTVPLIVQWNMLLGLKTSYDLSSRVSLSLLIYMLFTVIYWNACGVCDHNFSSDWSFIYRNTTRTENHPYRRVSWTFPKWHWYWREKRKSTQTFGPADDQAELRTDRHAHHFLVMACQNCSWCWVVS